MSDKKERKILLDNGGSMTDPIREKCLKEAEEIVIASCDCKQECYCAASDVWSRIEKLITSALLKKEKEIEELRTRVAELELSEAKKEIESRKSVCGCLAIEKENKELIEKVKALGKEMFKQNQFAHKREESLKARLQLMGEKVKELRDELGRRS